MTAADPPKPGAVRALLLGFGPAIAFLLSYLAAPVPEAEKIYVATAVFMAVAVICRLLTKTMPKRSLWPFPWAVAVIVGMGGLTLWLHDETFIKMRPTLYYGGGAAFMALHLLAFRPRLEALFAVNGLNFDDKGLGRLTLLLIAFGAGMAILNELVWRNSSDLFWIAFQIWGPLLAFPLFAAGSIPAVSPHWSGQCRVPGADRGNPG